MKQTRKKIDVSNVTIDRTRNYRDDVDYDVADLIRDIELRGVQDAVTVEIVKQGDEEFIYPLKGFRRLTALQEMLKSNVSGPDNKPIDKVEAIVFENLTDDERFIIRLDHGQRRGLSRTAVQRAFEDSFNVGRKETDTVMLLAGLLKDLYPPKKPIGPTPKDLLDYYKGVLQNAKLIHRLPEVARVECFKKLAGQQNWPRVKDMKELVDCHLKDMENDTTNTVSRLNPGPLFKDRWKKLITAITEAEVAGEARPKETSMASRDQSNQMKIQANSQIVKTTIDFILRNLAPSKFAEFDALVTTLEALAPKDFKTKLITLIERE